MFERFTETARRVVVSAQEQARSLNHNYIGTEHLLLGILAMPESAAAQVLMASGIDLGAARASVTAIIGTGGASPDGHIPFTPRAKKVLELSLREALQLSNKSIRSEHLLLGLLREGEGVAAQVLIASGLDLAVLRAKVLDSVADARRGDVAESSAAFAGDFVALHGESAAICSHCDSALGSPIGLVRTSAVAEDGESRDVVLLVCPTCGGTLGALSS
jgi:ATP-dependent Clp protease ATP-binding subunit ClpC